MPYPAVKVFMVEKVNVREVVVKGEPCDAHPDGCDRSRDRTETRFDVRRADTGEIVLTDASWMHGLPPGAMYWQEMSQLDPPDGPDDWDGYSQENLDSLRKSWAEHPEWYGGPYRPDPDERPPEWQGLPRRSQSHLFASGPQLTVVCPNGHEWNIDSRASNCTMPYDYEHRCWVRHGEPPDIHVDKQGHTCAAGAGSIQAADYHGFLHHGTLTAG